MGKTESGAIWLDEKLLSSYDYWQFWRNIDDRDVIKFLKMFTDLDTEEIDRIKNEDINKLKIKLANETTTMLHGKNEAKKAEKIAKELFSENSTGSNLPSIKMKFNVIKNLNIVDLIIQCKLENSKSEIRRLIKGNAIKIDNEIINDDKFIIRSILLNNSYFKLSIGKKRHFKIVS